MRDHYLWLMVGLGLCITEMLVGSFFLLVLGLAALAGAFAAWMGAGFWVQACVATFFAVVGVILVHRSRRHINAGTPLSFDVGQPVSFERWTSQGEGMARVNYRGSGWDARALSALDVAPGTILYIHAVDGNVLTVTDRKP